MQCGLTTDNTVPIRHEAHPVTGHVRDSDPQYFCAGVGNPDSDILLAARGKQISTAVRERHIQHLFEYKLLNNIRRWVFKKKR